MQTQSTDRRRRYASIVLLLTGAAWGLANVSALAQQGASNIAQNVASGRSYYFEVALVVVMVGAALFAVCRSSFRR